VLAYTADGATGERAGRFLARGAAARNGGSPKA
jgi:hypothetical protein